MLERVFTALVCLLWVAAPSADEPAFSTPLFEVEGAYEDALVYKGHLVLAVTEAEMGDPGLVLYKLMGKGKLKKSGRYFSTGNAHSVVQSGEYLLIANGALGFDVVDISNPMKPEEVSSLELKGYNQKVATQGDYAYVAAGFHGLHIIDIAKPEKLRLVSTFQAYAPPEKSTLTEEEAEGLFSERQEGEEVMTYNSGSSEDYYDVDDPSPEDVEEEVNLKDIERKDGAMDILLRGNTAYIAYGSAGLISVDISNPAKPVKTGELRLDWPVERLQFVGDLLHAATGIGGIQLIDVAQPGKMEVKGAYSTYCYPQDLALSGKSVVIADGYCGGNGLIRAMVDERYETQLTPLAPGNVGSVAVGGGMLFSMGPEKMQVFKAR